MRFRRALWLSVALLMLAGLVIGCEGGRTVKIGFRGSDTRRQKTARYVRFSGVERKSLRLEEGQTVRFEYDVEVDEGTLTLSLIDPDGETAWERTFEEAGADEVEISASQSGRYRLRIRGEATRGSYDVSWRIGEE